MHAFPSFLRCSAEPLLQVDSKINTIRLDLVDTLPCFETLLDLYHRRIYNLVFRLIGNADEAADLTQETFIRAYEAYSRFRGTSEAVYPWLCRIAVNNCKNKFREQSRRRQFEPVSLDSSPGSDADGSCFEIGDETLNPANVLERKELDEKVQEAISALPPDYRTVLVLRDMQGLTYKEIADATGLSLDNVKVRLFRGRGVVRRKLSAYIVTRF
jgi:RNA polymerase sigma-70 factor (ECF subfamily)